MCFIRLWKNLHFDGSSSRALRGLFRLTCYDSSFALNEIIKEKTISIFFLSISSIVRCVRVFSSRLEHHLLSKERTRSIILKYIELRIIALFSWRESERESKMCTLCTIFPAHNPCWWHIESIKKCFYILCVDVILWGSDFSANHFLQCGRVDAFLMQFYAKIHLKLINLPCRHFESKTR